MNSEQAVHQQIDHRTPRTQHWFVPWGWVYRPVTWQGMGFVLLTAVFCAQAFLAVDRHSHSASDTLYGIFPYVVPALILLNWVASKTSRAAA
jgi:hypothetical protein